MLVTSLVSPAAFAAWVCEGRTCGVSVWACCCAEGQNDANCIDDETVVGAGAARTCSDDCRCVMTMRSLDSERRTQSNGLVAPASAALLPHAPVALGEPQAEEVGFLEARGPPIAGAQLPAAALRGPPCLTLLIGS